MEVQITMFLVFGMPTTVLGLVCAAATPNVLAKLANGEAENLAVIKRKWVHNFLLTGLWMALATTTVFFAVLLAHLGWIALDGAVFFAIYLFAVAFCVPLGLCVSQTLDLYLQLLNCFRDPHAPNMDTRWKQIRNFLATTILILSPWKNRDATDGSPS